MSAIPILTVDIRPILAHVRVDQDLNDRYREPYEHGQDGKKNASFHGFPCEFVVLSN